MKTPRRSILAMLDDSVRWTGMPARVAAQMSGDTHRKHRPLRWTPIWPIAFSCVLFVTSLAWPQVLEGFSLAMIVSVLTGVWCGVFAMMPNIVASGPLGKSSLEDDEREAALRKDSFLFCLVVLALLNCIGQPAIMIWSHWQDWHAGRIASVATTGFMLNAALFGCLPTLYASWNLRQLPQD
jgi:hypothetical protein